MRTPDLTTPSAAGHTSRTEVATDAPKRYAKQLVSHLGRKVDFVERDGSWTATVLGAVARITVGDRALAMHVEGPDPDSVARVERALGSHLERFGQREQLDVTWQRTSPQST